MRAARRLRDVSRALARRRRKLNDPARQRILEPFFAGRHQLVADRFLAEPDADWTRDERHHILAAMASVNADVTAVAALIPPPWTREQFAAEFPPLLRAEVRENRLNTLGQPVIINKLHLATEIALANGRRNFVETGTYIGQSIYSVAGLFEHITTIEASPTLNAAARALFAAKGIANIDARNGDSRAALKELSPSYLDDALIFLDAHYSMGITSRLYGACPIIEEVRIIIDKAPNAIVVVDDTRTMNGMRGYPTLQEIFEILPSSMRVQFMFDQLIFMPSDRGTVPIFH